MSMALCKPVPQNYTCAAIKDAFFDPADERSLEKLEKREQPPLCAPHESCTTNLFFGFFFDGTRNNYEKAEPTKSHSNVARLYDCFPGQSVKGVLPKNTDWQYKPDRYSHFFRVYIPGVASPFKEVKDDGKGTFGGAMGAGGQARIVWALVQAINNVNRYFLGEPLLSPAESTAVATDLSLSKLARGAMTGSSPSTGTIWTPSWQKPRIEFEKLLKRLHANVSQHWKRNGARPAKVNPAIVETIFVSTFGFSRGATQARAFSNWLCSLCRLDAIIRGEGTLSLGGFPVVFDFLGLFDSVASIGAGNTLANAPLIPETNGHWSWADAEDSLRISPSINRCVHLVAGHELRRSFPLDSIAVGFTLPDRSEETVFPGVHADVGGAYKPREHGKGIDENGADMLSRMPLLYMYKEARLAGVPLKLELADEVVKMRFATTSKAIADFNAYIGACTKTSGRVTDIIREQAILQMAWRYMRRRNGPTPLHKTANFLRVDHFQQNDLDSANKDFEDELRDFEAYLARRGVQRPQTQKPGFNNNYDNELEEIAGYWPLQQPATEVLHFFDEYVHDSRAGFKLNGQDFEAAAIEQLKDWSRCLAAAKRRYDPGIDSSAAEGPPNYGMAQNDRMAAEEFDRTGKIPRYHVSGRESYQYAKAGYFRFRKIYGGADDVLLSNWHPPARNDIASTTDASEEMEDQRPHTSATPSAIG